MKIAILGAGAFGTALGGILADNGYDIDYYDKRLENEKLSDVLSGAKYMVLCVPSNAIPYLLPHLPKDLPLIVASKGIIDLHTFDDFVDYMIISGPSFACDVKARKNTSFTVTDKRLLDLFKGDYVKFDYTKDKIGVLLCGALKNVYALQAGYLGLERDSKEWNEYITKAHHELKVVLSENGALSSTADHFCGIDDLKLTCGRPSRNYEYGDNLRKNHDYRPTTTVEGLSVISRIVTNAITIPQDAVILHDILERFKDVA